MHANIVSVYGSSSFNTHKPPTFLVLRRVGQLFLAGATTGRLKGILRLRETPQGNVRKDTSITQAHFVQIGPVPPSYPKSFVYGSCTYLSNAAFTNC